jgi:glycosyltransferase involved in cell wall biosynthesis/polysaccharide pyruvyl transferase WcaK-like protein
MKKIAHFGAFDHDSYGDLLFPFVAEHLWPDFAFTHVAPTDQAPAWSDVRPIIGVSEAVERTDWDGILVGGGDIIQTGAWSAPKWAQHLDVPFAALPSLWVGASLLAAKLDLPVAWNAPGVPVPVPDFFASAARSALGCVDYLSVRDRSSQGHLAGLASQPIAVVADTAITVARLWPAGGRRGHVVLSLSQYDLRSRPEDIRQAVLRLRSLLHPEVVEIVVLPLMRWEFDPEAMTTALREAHVEARVATECLSLESASRLIGSARGYVGNSLHGLIVALAYGVPAVLVVPAHNRASPKYAGFLQESGVDQSRHLTGAWVAAADRLLAQQNVCIPAQAWECLDRHRDRVQAALLGQVSGKRRVWQRASQAEHVESDRMVLLGVPPRTFMGLARHRQETLEARVSELCAGYERQITGMNRAFKEDVDQLVSSLDAISGSRSWKLTAPLRFICSHAEQGCRIASLPVRLVQYLVNPVLRRRALNTLGRRWAVWRQRSRVVELPGLDWLLGKLQLDVSAAQVAAKLGPYMTRRDEENYAAMIGSLRAAGEGEASRVMRASALVPAPGTTPTRRRILFVCGEFPNPVHGGGGRVADFVKALNGNHDVYVGAWYDRRRDHEAFLALEPHCRGLLRLGFEDLEGGCVGKLLELIDHKPVDVVHYEWPRSLNSFDHRLGRHHIYTHMEAVSCSLWIDLRRLEPLSPTWLRRMAQLLDMLKMEVLDVLGVDAQVVVTPKDGEFLSRFSSGQSYFVVNHGINRGEFDVADVPGQPRTLVFTGNFIHYPNVDAVHYFMREIRPGILAAVPDVRVMLVGAHPTAELLRYQDGERVIVTGRVPDIRPYIQKASVCIAPLISGAGLRTKVVQYAALRRPCVATTIAAEDMGFEDEQEILIADSPGLFAARVVELLLDPARAAAMAECARKRAMDTYDNQRIADRDLVNLYHRLDAGKESS